MDIGVMMQVVINFAFDNILIIILVILAVLLIRIRFVRVVLLILLALFIVLSLTNIIPVKSTLEELFSGGKEKSYVFEEQIAVNEEESLVKIKLGGGKIQVKAEEGGQLKVLSQIDDIKISQTKTNQEDSIFIEEEHIINNVDPLARNTLISLGKDKKWSLSVDSGASQLDMDCRDLNLQELSIITGAGHANVYLGNRVETVYLSGGASNIKIHVPKTLGILVTENGFFNENFQKLGLIKTEVGYQSKDLEEKNGIVHLKVEMGISNLEIIEYEGD